MKKVAKKSIPNDVDQKLMDRLAKDLIKPLIKGRLSGEAIRNTEAPTKLSILYTMMPQNVKDVFQNDVAMWCDKNKLEFGEVWDSRSYPVYYYSKRYIASISNYASNPKSVKSVNVAVSSPVSEEINDRMNGLIPPPSIRAMYVSRNIEDKPDMEILKSAYDSNPPDNVMLEGHCGTGKNVMIRAFCSQFKIPIYRFNFNGCSTPDQLFGYKTIDADGKVAWVDGPVTTMMRYGGIVVGDEIHSAREDILFAMFSVLDERQILLPDNGSEVVVAHPKFMFIATTNPDTYAGVRKSNPAFKDRFGCWLQIGNDEGVEKKLVKNKKILKLVDVLRSAYAFGIFGDAPVSTRQIVNLDSNINKYGTRLAMRMFSDRYVGQVDNEVIKILTETSDMTNDESFNKALEKIKQMVTALNQRQL